MYAFLDFAEDVFLSVKRSLTIGEEKDDRKT